MMSKKINRVHLTETEQLAAGRVMLAAALTALGDYPEDSDVDVIAKKVVRALVAAGAAKHAECARLEKEKGEKAFVYVDTGPSYVVGSAFFLWSEGVDYDMEDVAPESAMGAKYVAFAQGMSAAHLMTEVMDLMEDGSMFAFHPRGAEKLLPLIDDGL